MCWKEVEVGGAELGREGQRAECRVQRNGIALY